MNPGISVIICCYNSEQRIAPTLQHLAAQELGPELPWEIVLVDNCCSDNTVITAKTVWADISSAHKPPLHIVKEDQPGLSWARQKGLNAAKYDTICFCDDDNWLQPDYLTIAFHIMKNNHEIGVLAGQGIAASSIPIPEWFYSYQGLYACGKLAEKSGDITSNKWVWGAGMVLRTETLKKMYVAGFYHLNDDRKGNSLSSGGDTEICYWHILTGQKLWYDEGLVFTHFVSPERITKEVAEKINAEHDKSYNNLSPYFPLIFCDQFKNTPKVFLFLKALLTIIKRQEGSALFVHLQPIFNFRLHKKTQEILHHLKKYKVDIN